jgi:hypothetical protein
VFLAQRSKKKRAWVPTDLAALDVEDDSNAARVHELTPDIGECVAQSSDGSYGTVALAFDASSSAAINESIVRTTTSTHQSDMVTMVGTQEDISLNGRCQQPGTNTSITVGAATAATATLRASQLRQAPMTTSISAAVPNSTLFQHRRLSAPQLPSTLRLRPAPSFVQAAGPSQDHAGATLGRKRSSLANAAFTILTAAPAASVDLPEREHIGLAQKRSSLASAAFALLTAAPASVDLPGSTPLSSRRSRLSLDLPRQSSIAISHHQHPAIPAFPISRRPPA